MKIVILTFGSRGDVQPMLALGLGLQAAGHQVRIATHQVFEEFVRSVGLEFAEITGDPQQALASERGQDWVNSGQNSFAFLYNFVRLTRPYFRQQLRDCQRACEGVDFIIFTPFAGGGLDIAEQMDLPVALAALQPFHPTGAFPAMGSFGTFGNAFLNRGSHLTTGYLLWLPFRDIHNRWRIQDLGLPARGLKGPMTSMEQRQVPALYGYSPEVIPRPEDWSPWVHVTGYWFLEGDPGWAPTPELEQFLASGTPPIFMGFGSMIRQDGNALIDIARQAAEELGERFLLQRGWQQLDAGEDHPNLMVIDSAPHSWLFPRMAAVVHHGGAGTTAAGLRAGVPSVLVPHFADQFFWGKWVVARHAGPPAIPRSQLTAASLVSALRTALSARTRAHAASLGARIRQEDGIARAVAILERSSP
jgi:UDP:flavonoid glycosyltransferase YjiC (YdhE family)